MTLREKVQAALEGYEERSAERNAKRQVRNAEARVRAVHIRAAEKIGQQKKNAARPTTETALNTKRNIQ